MPHYVGLDASKTTTSICILNEKGERIREGSVATEPAAIIGFLRGEGRRYARIGVEPLDFAPWLYERLAKARLPIICIDATHAHNVLKQRLNKTDRNDAWGIAELMRIGAYKSVHMKSPEAQRVRLLLVARANLVRQRRNIDNLVGAALLQLGLKLRKGRADSLARRVAAVAPKSGVTREVLDGLLGVRAAIVAQIKTFEAAIDRVAENDPVCRRLRTAPGVGVLTALSFRAAIDIPERFARTRNVGVHLGMTPRTYQSGPVERRGRISKCGDTVTRSSLWLAARTIMQRRARSSPLKTWGMQVAARRGAGRAIMAVARRLAMILHRMWLNGTDFQQEGQTA
jgi:transposase